MNDNEEKILGVFFDNPSGKFYVREIARITKLNPNTVLNITEKLIKQDLLKKEKKKHIVEFSAILEEKFKKLKKINNLKKIYDSGVIEHLTEKFSPEAIVLIGSYSIGEDIKDKNIDIVIISKKDYNSMNLKKFEDKLNKSIHPIVVDYNKISDEFYINLINGIVLYGAINKK